MKAARRRRAYLRFALGLAVVGGIVALVASGWFRELSGPVLRETIRDSGAWGPLAFVALFTLLQPFGFSAHILVVTSSMVWDAPLAIGLSWLGAMGATCTAYWFARYIGRAWVQDRLPDRLKAYDKRLADGGVRTIFIMRLLFYTFAPMQLMLGVSSARFRDVLIASAPGVLPGILVEVAIGASLYDWLVT